MPQAADPSTPSPSIAPSYEDALAELERIVQGLESGSMPLDGMLQNYRRGAELLNFCRERLQAVDEQVRLIDGTVFKSKRSA